MSVDSEEGVSRGSRWLRIFGGLILVLISLLFLMGSAALFFKSPSGDLLNKTVGGVVFLVSLWLLIRGIRLVFNRPVRGGLMSPLALRIAAVVFFCIPWIGLWTGYYQEHRFLKALQALIYLIVSVNLWGMAQSRSLRDPGHESTKAGPADRLR